MHLKFKRGSKPDKKQGRLRQHTVPQLLLIQVMQEELRRMAHFVIAGAVFPPTDGYYDKRIVSPQSAVPIIRMFFDGFVFNFVYVKAAVQLDIIIKELKASN